MWFKVGRDPRRGTIIPLFQPPPDISPAAARYISRMNFDDRGFASAILDMAAKGFMEIHQSEDGYNLVKSGGGKRPLSRGEWAIAHTLFDDHEQLDVAENNMRMRSAKGALGVTLEMEFDKASFRLNAGYIAPGLFLTVLGGGTAVFGSETLFMTPSPADLGAIALILACGFTIWLFTRLLKAPTVTGRRLLDQIEGFKMYLSTAEQHRLEALHPPDVTPEVFEKYLPYAMALDVENEWNDKFNAYIAAAGLDLDRDGGYRPVWYVGPGWAVADIGHVASDLCLMMAIFTFSCRSAAS